jgi:hypothetical protein
VLKKIDGEEKEKERRKEKQSLEMKAAQGASIFMSFFYIETMFIIIIITDII